MKQIDSAELIKIFDEAVVANLCGMNDLIDAVEEKAILATNKPYSGHINYVEAITNDRKPL